MNQEEQYTLHPWQKDLEQILVRPCTNNRIVHWYWNPDGNIGKSFFAEYMYKNHGAIDLNDTNVKTINFCVKGLQEKGNVPVIFDLPRAIGNRINYGHIKSLKDGIFSIRGRPILFDSPHVVIFSCCPPREEMLSPDQWNIVKL